MKVTKRHSIEKAASRQNLKMMRLKVTARKSLTLLAAFILGDSSNAFYNPEDLRHRSLLTLLRIHRHRPTSEIERILGGKAFHFDSSLFSDKNLWNLMKIRRSDVNRVLRVLQLYDRQFIDCGDGTLFSGEELFLVSRYKFVTGATFSAMELIFHRDETELSKAFEYSWLIS